MKEAHLAKGADYFGIDGFPITIRRVSTAPGHPVSHEHDVTGIDHYHDFSELVLILEGAGCHSLDGKRFPVSAGDVFVIQGQQVHSFPERDGLVLLNVMYDAARLPLPTELFRRLPGYSALFVLEPTFRGPHRFSSRLRLNRVDLGIAESIGASIEKEAARQSPGDEAMRLSHLINLIVFLSRRYGESDTRESLALLRIGRLIGALDQGYAEDWSLDRLARAARLSRAGLLRVFRQATGKSPIAYLIGLRIEAAKRLLRNDDLDMMEIAHRTGFTDSNYFARQFRLVEGCSPTEFRRRLRSF